MVLMSAANSEFQPGGPVVNSLDRFGFTLFIAVAMHAIFLLGIGFEAEKPPKIAQTLEVTLAQFASDQAPEKADFIAQQNQQGSGESEQKKLPTTTDRALFQANETRQIASQQLPTPREAVKPEAQIQPTAQPSPSPTTADPNPQAAQRPIPKTVVSKSTEAPTKKQQQSAPAKAMPPLPTVGQSSSLLARSLEIASLEAKLDTQIQALASKPRIRRLYSASTRESYDAAYLDGWRRKVERVGNLNYPEEAHRRQLYGQLRLLVVIEPDGSLNRVEVLKSSGYRVLDDAAKRIVHLSAPFAPFPPEIRKRADLIEIIRTWRFEQTRFGVNG